MSIYIYIYATSKIAHGTITFLRSLYCCYCCYYKRDKCIHMPFHVQPIIISYHKHKNTFKGAIYFFPFILNCALTIKGPQEIGRSVYSRNVHISIYLSQKSNAILSIDSFSFISKSITYIFQDAKHISYCFYDTLHYKYK